MFLKNPDFIHRFTLIHFNQTFNAVNYKLDFHIVASSKADLRPSKSPSLWSYGLLGMLRHHEHGTV